MINLNTAYMDATDDETDFTAGVNALWHRFELWVISMRITKSKAFNATIIDAVCEGRCWITDPGNYDIHTITCLIFIPQRDGYENFNIYLGLCFMGGRPIEE